MIRIIQLLLLIALLLVIWRLARKWLSPRLPGAGRTGDPPRFEPTQRCAQCGTHVPRDQLDAAGLCPDCQSR